LSFLGISTVLVLIGCSASITPNAPVSPPSATPPSIARLPRISTSEPTSQKTSPTESSSETSLQAFSLPPGSRPHDVAPADDGGIWYTAQGSGALGWLDPETGETRHTSLGVGSRPHGVIVGPDGAPWITDGGLNAIVRVDPASQIVDIFPLPQHRSNANLNTATFDDVGVLWFTGQNGVYGRFDPRTLQMDVFDAPRGRGPYGIATSANGDIYFASLAGSYVGRIDPDSGEVTVLEPPTPDQGARRVWSDSQGRIWTSEWNAGQALPPTFGRSGNYPDRRLVLTRSMWTRMTLCGSAISAATRWFGSTRAVRNLACLGCRITPEMSGRSMADPERFGCRSPRQTGSW